MSSMEALLRSPGACRTALSPARPQARLPRASTRVVAYASNKSDGSSGSSSAAAEDFRTKLSPAMVQLFNEAERNVMRINQSRLEALRDLKVARLRIEELEAEVESLRSEQSQQVSVPAAQAQAAADPLTPEPQTQPQPTQPQPAQPPPLEQEPEPEAPSASMTVVYETGWDDVYMHYSMDGGKWTDAPGAHMARGAYAERPHAQVISIDGADVLEFVMNNGNNQWDSPPTGKNYRIDSPGTYLVKHGKVRKL